MQIDCRRLVPADANLLAEFLTAEPWPCHAGGTPDPGRIRRDVIDGYYERDDTRTFWIVTDTEVGLIRLTDLADDTPLFDLRIRAAHRWQARCLPSPASASRRRQAHSPARSRCAPAALATWRERALNAEDALRAAHAEITTLKSASSPPTTAPSTSGSRPPGPPCASQDKRIAGLEAQNAGPGGP